MHQNNILNLPSLTQDRYENIFNVYTDNDGHYYYNLLQSISIPQNLPDSFFTQYITQPGDTLPYISYKIFNTINLWWLICAVNNITNPIDPIESGKELKIPSTAIAREVLKQINI
jgi:LysM repeat protein